MKVIDLLNKITNEEDVPKKIQVYDDIFVFNNYNKVYDHQETRTNLLSIYNGHILNYEVAIIEEDKGIEKIDGEYFERAGINYKSTLLKEKLDELIDKINEMREDK